ncbi:MAG TPA: bacteriohopanetetrol glucosamine biosynthesis glycosyltransferase HpnI [Acidobacteriaceae bacterium]|nr:bacteriohopanetetrol glucosamine biosynthesis glycosyltransferase HpnI [Acidobacteriaceae bacterium]
MFASIVASVTTIVTFFSLFYFMAALLSARGFLRRHMPEPADFAPGVSILKPIKGFDQGMYEAFASHCRQKYPGEYELLFGVSSLDDPAVAAVHRLQAEFPDEPGRRSIRLILCPEKLGLNGKISNVVQMAAQARFDYLILNDSDIHVSPRYLSRILAPFAAVQPSRSGVNKPVGLVTAPYRGIAHGTIGSKMEALGISTDFFPGVLTALMLDREIRFGLGSTLAVSRAALDASGGFEALVNSLADDYQLGLNIANAGYAIVLSREIVDTSVPAYSLAGFFSHQLRWARGVRDSRRLGYLGLIFTYGVPLAVFNCIASAFGLPSLALLSLTLAARLTVALTIGVGVLRDRQVIRDLWLLPLRDFCALWVWVWSFASNTVTWRGEEFLLRDGKLTAL